MTEKEKCILCKLKVILCILEIVMYALGIVLSAKQLFRLCKNTDKNEN
ncbi:MAG: hypothetical protein LUF89_02695 [Ruminococcus sp.]|nr:hypothetical protein [Ruminococcus sp.]